MQVGKARAIGADLEHRAITQPPVIVRRPIQSGARQYQSAIRSRPVAVRIRASIRQGAETVHVRKTRAIGLTLEYYAAARITPRDRRAVQRRARQNNLRKRIRPIRPSETVL